MASILKHLRSSTADKRPTASGLAEGQIAINTASGSPGIFFKDSNSNVVKVGPVHVGAAAPNASPAGSAGNSLGELWVDNSLTTPGLNYYSGSAFVNLTPSGTTTTVGLVELATNAETQAGADAVRAVTSAGLQSKVSDSISTTSSTTIASATAVKTAYDLANAALPKSGGTVTGEILISPSGSLVFEGSSDDSFETTLAVVNPTADRIITLPNITGTVVTTGDTGSVTSTMIADGTIVNADINASAAIDPSKLGSGALPSGVTVASANIVDGTIVNADVNASAAIAGTKISPDFGGQNVVTTGSITGASLIPSSATVPTNGVYLPAANTVGISTNGTGQLFVDASGNIGVGTAATTAAFIDTKKPTAGNVVRLRAESGVTFASYAIHGDELTNGVVLYNYGSTYAASSLLNVGANGSTLNCLANFGVNVASGKTLRFGVGNAELLRITSDGKLGVGTTSPEQLLDVRGVVQIKNAGTCTLRFNDSTTNYWDIQNDSNLRFSRGGSEYARIDSSGRLGIGTTIPVEQLHVSGSSAINARFESSGTTASIRFANSTASDGYIGYTNQNLTFTAANAERARIDSSGRLLVGTSTARANFNNLTGTCALQVEGANGDTASASIVRASADAAGPSLRLGKSRSSTNAVLLADDGIGNIQFQGNDGTEFVRCAEISAYVDGTPGANDMPGRLVFSTTADGASSPTERMRIDSEGNIRFGGVGYFREVAGTPYIIEFGSFPGTTYSVERQIQFYANTNNGSSAERMRISGAGAIFFPGVGTTASAANAFLNSGSSPANQLLRSTSSLRYKTNIEDLEEERSNSILNFRPVWYRSTADADRKDWSWYGLIAEEVAAIEPRLVHWTYLDDAYEEVDGEKQLKPNAEMVPDGVQYDRLTVLLLDVVKRQQQAIENLQAEVAALKAS